MAETLANASVRKSVRVNAPIAHAFSVFIEQMETWWPPTHHIGTVPFVALIVEPRIGGRWYEVNAQGEQCPWGTVLAWEPPQHVVFSWHVGPGHDSPDWVADPSMEHASEVEIRFTAEAPDWTLVELTHSKLDRHGKGWEQLRDIFEGPGAWSAILAGYATRAAGGNTR